ncbi:hypothetical protein BS50DRAFT_586215 [Corynespora cassiicola Philippines]|uniref:Uncharacterized protein n=1 Tax=Corynespora cassiicola Philippines TaxID=1448308 RepID=A0A2T2NTP3_CORCC|nr:hypothetical protein BS50DRAFT_586215 [Corynespora cassiicola Philippines]
MPGVFCRRYLCGHPPEYIQASKLPDGRTRHLILPVPGPKDPFFGLTFSLHRCLHCAKKHQAECFGMDPHGHNFPLGVHQGATQEDVGTKKDGWGDVLTRFKYGDFFGRDARYHDPVPESEHWADGPRTIVRIRGSWEDAVRGDQSPEDAELARPRKSMRYSAHSIISESTVKSSVKPERSLQNSEANVENLRPISLEAYPSGPVYKHMNSLRPLGKAGTWPDCKPKEIVESVFNPDGEHALLPTRFNSVRISDSMVDSAKRADQGLEFSSPSNQVVIEDNTTPRDSPNMVSGRSSRILGSGTEDFSAGTLYSMDDAQSPKRMSPLRALSKKLNKKLL